MKFENLYLNLSKFSNSDVIVCSHESIYLDYEKSNSEPENPDSDSENSTSEFRNPNPDSKDVCLTFLILEFK